jgi:hypothetical protein
MHITHRDQIECGQSLLPWPGRAACQATSSLRPLVEMWVESGGKL